MKTLKMKHIDMKKIYSMLALLCATFMVVSCNNEIEETEDVGYLKLAIETYTSTNTRAVSGVPDGYNAKTMHVELRNAAGAIVMQTDDFANSSDFQGNIVLSPGTYAIEAHSANWDGSDSGFGAPYYAGMTTVTVKAKELATANITCTQANVKVTVNYDASFVQNFKAAQTVVTSDIDDVAPRAFRMNSTVGSAYFPVAPLNLLVSVTNMKNESFVQNNRIVDVKARDHYIITYKVAEAGNLGGVTVSIDDATQTYTYTVAVPRKSSTALQANNVNAWSRFANLTGSVTAKTTDFDATGVTFQWKQQNATEWTTVENSALTNSGDNFSYKLTGLIPQTTYSFRMSYVKGDISVNSNEVTFTTDSETEIYNSSFENWYMKDSKVWMPNEEGTTYWDSSNSGSAGLMGAQYNVTLRSTDYVHSGSYSAKIQSMYVIVKFAAGSIFTGQFGSLKGTNGASLNWGVPFTSRPSALKAFMRYTPGDINRGNKPSGVGAPDKGEKDYCSIRVALMTEQLDVDNTDMSTFPDWENDPRILAYGYYEQNTADSDWKEVNIPITYYNTTTKPTHLLIAVASSKFGDYFYGSDSSVMYLDDLEFEYNEPTIR